MKQEFAPHRLDVSALAQSSGHLSGEEPLSKLTRVMRECRETGEPPNVSWSASGEIRAGQPDGGQPWLHLKVDVSVPLTCQRCLEAVVVRLLVDRWFRFVADEESAAAQDDDSEEDLLALTSELNLQELIEDELLLELPMIPRHVFCPGQSSLAREDGFGVAVAGRPNPFAALAQLRKGDGSDSG